VGRAETGKCSVPPQFKIRSEPLPGEAARDGGRGTARMPNSGLPRASLSRILCRSPPVPSSLVSGSEARATGSLGLRIHLFLALPGFRTRSNLDDGTTSDAEGPVARRWHAGHHARRRRAGHRPGRVQRRRACAGCVIAVGIATALQFVEASLKELRQEPSIHGGYGGGE
jgi:hypothetical protein